ncbi:hypothetical protein [Halomonas sp. Mc5H-6]|uniref:hypothetical protein n=1 Tax=Halomonas sp. Mc5H-6 TaxID=2954500 RepID=UPI002097B903|nr:hypothetical protein [Halomonas sp. Mc5H-6]MCO7247965.1 hypothetical protein [Halomonas sp. Mc5H-6]
MSMEHFKLSPEAPSGVLIDDIDAALEKAKDAVKAVEIVLCEAANGEGTDINPGILAGVLWSVETQLHIVTELAQHAYKTSEAKGGKQS